MKKIELIIFEFDHRERCFNTSCFSRLKKCPVCGRIETYGKVKLQIIPIKELDKNIFK